MDMGDAKPDVKQILVYYKLKDKTRKRESSLYVRKATNGKCKVEANIGKINIIFSLW